MREVKLKELVGKAISGEWGDEGNRIKVLRSTNFTNDGRLDLASVVERSISESKILKKKLRKGDLILEKSGGSPKQPVGRVVLFDEEGEYVTNNFTATLRPNHKLVYSKYLLYILLKGHQAGSTLIFQNKTTGIINLQVNQYLEKTQIPLPPLPTQRRIAAALDLADRQRQLLRAEIAAYGELGESLFLEMFGDPTRKPLKFQSAPLGKLGDWKSGGTPSRSKPEYFTGSIPWLSSGELNEMYNTGSKERITKEAVLESNAKIIEPNSLLLGMYDTAALKSTITTKESTCNQAIAYSSLSEDIANVVYVYHAIQIGKEHFRRLQRGVRQKNLNLTMIKSLRIPLPPIKLQEQFATRIQKIEALEAKAETALAEADDLFNTLLQRAFRGELFSEEVVANP